MTATTAEPSIDKTDDALLDNFVQPYPRLIEDLRQWPVCKLSDDRENFKKEIVAYTEERLKILAPDQNSLIEQVLFQERNRLRDTPWKVDSKKEKKFWRDVRKRLLQMESQTVLDATKNREALITDIIEHYAEEIVAKFSPAVFSFSSNTLFFFFSRLLNAAVERWWRFLGSRYRLHQRIQVFGDVELIRDLSQKGILVVMPTHFSNIDSILVGFAMDSIMGLPSFSYGAGINLSNSSFFAFFINRLGAYQVDRRKKNQIYLETLKAMSTLSLERGTNTLFFPGGTRARSGALETKLKMGLMGTTLEAQRALFQKGEDKKIVIVPLVMSYHFVLEAPHLIHQYLQIEGKEKFLKNRFQGNNLLEWLKFIWQFFAKKSEILLSFDHPMDVFGNRLDADLNSIDKHGNIIYIKDYFSDGKDINTDLQRETEFTKLLAEKITDRFHKANMVLSSHLVAFAAYYMLSANYDMLDLYSLLRLSVDDFYFPREELIKAIDALRKEVLVLAKKDKLKISSAILLDPEELLVDGITKLGAYNLIKPLVFNKKGNVESDELSVLFYYKNRLENYGLSKKVTWSLYKLGYRKEE